MSAANWTRAGAEAVVADAAILHPEIHEDLFELLDTGEMFHGRYRRFVYLCALAADPDVEGPYVRVHQALLECGVHRNDRDGGRLLALTVADGVVDRSHRGVEAARELVRLDGADRLRRLLVSAASSLAAGIDPEAVADRLRRST